MDVLLVGAGAVGQVYGHHLRRGGARVAFLVKPKHLDPTRAGHTLYALNRDGLRTPLSFTPDAVHTPDTLKDSRWDAIILCVSSPALRGPLLSQLAPHVGDATVVCLQPATSDHALVAAHVASSQLVDGGISLVAYASPLPGEEVAQPGTAFWFPPLAASILSGPADRVDALVSVFRKGGLPMKRTHNAALELAIPGALLMVLVALLEQHSWSLGNLQGDQLATLQRGRSS